LKDFQRLSFRELNFFFNIVLRFFEPSQILDSRQTAFEIKKLGKSSINPGESHRNFGIF